MVNISGTLAGDDGRQYQISITPVSAPPTVTALLLDVAPAAPQVVGTALTLTATVSPDNAVGSVTFTGVNDSNPVPVTNGVATKTFVPTSAGSLSFGASFTPANSAVFTPSTADPVTGYTVTSGESVLTGPNYTPTVEWDWTVGPLLAAGAATATTGDDQYAEADFAGLVDEDHNAGFVLRSDGMGGGVLAVLTNASFKIEDGGSGYSGSRTPSASGHVRFEIEGSGSSTVVRAYVGGNLIATAPVTLPAAVGRGVQPAVWQSSAGVSLSTLRASSLGAVPPQQAPGAPTLTGGTAGSGQVALSWTPADGRATSYKIYRGGTVLVNTTSATSYTVSSLTNGTPYTFTVVASNTAGDSPASNAVTVTPTAPAGGGAYVLGASGEGVGNGNINAWQANHLVGAAATWVDVPGGTFVNVAPGGEYGNWSGLLDVAVGGIWKSQGDSWSAAAAGSYTGRWRSQLQALAAAWGSRDPRKLLVRFAHEFNGNWFDWHVTSSEASAFAQAFSVWSDVLHQEIPGAWTVWSPANNSSGGHATPAASWPAYGVDAIGVDMYNQYPHVTSAADVRSTWINATYTAEWWRQFAESRGVPMYFAEIGNPALDSGGGAGGGDAPEFFTEIHNWCKTHGGQGPGQVLSAIWFNISSGYAAHFRFAVNGNSADPLQPQFAERFRTAV